MRHLQARKLSVPRNQLQALSAAQCNYRLSVPRHAITGPHARTHLGIVREPLQHVDEIRAVEGVAPDAHARGLAQAHRRGLVHCLVCQRAGAADDADLSRLVDVSCRRQRRRTRWVRGITHAAAGCTLWRLLNVPGMIPILHSPGLMMPGQFGPINRVLVCCASAYFTCTLVQTDVTRG